MVQCPIIRRENTKIQQVNNFKLHEANQSIWLLNLAYISEVYQDEWTLIEGLHGKFASNKLTNTAGENVRNLIF